MAKTHAKRLSDIVALLALCAACWLVAPLGEANAATNTKQRVVREAKKPDAKKREPNKPATDPALEGANKNDRAVPKQAEKKQAKKQAAKKKIGRAPWRER